MVSWITLYEPEGVNTNLNYKGRYGQYPVKKTSIGSRLYFTFGTIIRTIIKTIGAPLLSQ